MKTIFLVRCLDTTESLVSQTIESLHPWSCIVYKAKNALSYYSNDHIETVLNQNECEDCFVCIVDAGLVATKSEPLNAANKNVVYYFPEVRSAWVTSRILCCRWTKFTRLSTGLKPKVFPSPGAIVYSNRLVFCYCSETAEKAVTDIEHGYLRNKHPRRGLRAHSPTFDPHRLWSPVFSSCTVHNIYELAHLYSLDNTRTDCLEKIQEMTKREHIKDWASQGTDLTPHSRDEDYYTLTDYNIKSSGDLDEETLCKNLFRALRSTTRWFFVLRANLETLSSQIVLLDINKIRHIIEKYALTDGVFSRYLVSYQTLYSTLLTQLVSISVATYGDPNYVPVTATSGTYKISSGDKSSNLAENHSVDEDVILLAVPHSSVRPSNRCLLMFLKGRVSYFVTGVSYSDKSKFVLCVHDNIIKLSVGESRHAKSYHLVEKTVDGATKFIAVDQFPLIVDGHMPLAASSGSYYGEKGAIMETKNRNNITNYNTKSYTRIACHVLIYATKQYLLFLCTQTQTYLLRDESSGRVSRPFVNTLEPILAFIVSEDNNIITTIHHRNIISFAKAVVF